MRPVRLDLDGFASFREPTTVDFADADYFALVGPTGSGKSTVIDAMTFALYGSAPRWGSVSSIQYALAPTANRGTVRLIFDVNGARYVVAREVRRSPQGAVSQKSSLLERFVDPAATGAEEDATEPLAADPRGVRQQVVELLGLEFDDFCTCVVLPQGEFATFLQASVTERQNILLKLIGAKIYDTIGRVAGQRADAARYLVQASEAQLGELADATPEREHEARDREAELTALAAEVDAAVASIRRQATDRSQAASALADAEGEIGQLAEVSAPAGVAGLQAEIAAADSAYELALGAVRQATAAAVEADRSLAAGPRRAQVEETLRWHADVADATTRLATVRVEEQRAEQTLADATLASATARELADRHRAAHHEAEQRVRAAGERAEGVRRQLTELRAVEPPPNLAVVSAGLAAARTAREDARQAVAVAEAARSDADRALRELPDRGTRERIRQTLDDLAQASDEATALTATTTRLDDEATTAEQTLAAGRAELTAAHAEWEELRTRSVAADLRPHLDVGEPCPVCDQAVTTLPPPLAAPKLATAATRRDTAEQSVTEAEQTWRRLAAEAQGAAERTARVEATREARDRQLSDLLPQQPSGANRDVAQDRGALERLEQSSAEATTRVRQAAAAVEQAQDARRAAEDRLETLAEQAQAAWAGLNGATGRLAPLGAPAVTTADLGEAWRVLHDWATSEANRISLGVLPELDAEVTAGSAALREATERRDSAVDADLAAREQATRATSTHHGARQERDRLEQHLVALAARLADRPSTAGAQAQLIECSLREQAAAQARDALDAAAERRDGVERDRNRLAVARDDARRELHRTRDPLVRLGAPVVDDRDLAKAWADLGSWAQQRLATRRGDVERRRTEVSGHGSALTAAIADLTGRLGAHEVAFATSLGVDDNELGTRVGEASTAVRVEGERARAVTERVVARRAEAARLAAKIAEDTETQQVAAELQRLMRSQKFPQWLANAALDTLVADASASLMTLSNEQFELTHERGEFFVIDHADADSKRSVRTLSGGETFQASLALALALSEQLATLAAGGRTTLDSIFLDEGFGTLDPEALEVVAGTLENLAQQDRMVGVVTHVSALAERIPVRFEVTRDSRTSRVERAGP